MGAFQIPTADGRRPLVVTYATGFCVYDKTEYPEEALVLADYLASEESQQIWLISSKTFPDSMSHH